MLDGQVADLVNHLLARADWARETLRPFGGAVVAVAIGPVSWRLAITAAGLLAAALLLIVIVLLPSVKKKRAETFVED